MFRESQPIGEHGQSDRATIRTFQGYASHFGENFYETHLPAAGDQRLETLVFNVHYECRTICQYSSDISTVRKTQWVLHFPRRPVTFYVCTAISLFSDAFVNHRT